MTDICRPSDYEGYRQGDVQRALCNVLDLAHLARQAVSGETPEARGFAIHMIEEWNLSTVELAVLRDVTDLVLGAADRITLMVNDKEKGKVHVLGYLLDKTTGHVAGINITEIAE